MHTILVIYVIHNIRLLNKFLIYKLTNINRAIPIRSDNSYDMATKLLMLVFNLQGTLSINFFLTEPVALNSYLCDPDFSLLPDTQLLLSTDVYHILS